MRLLTASRALLVMGISSALLMTATSQTSEDLGRECTLRDGSHGTCKRLKDCHTVLENVTRGIYDHERCGFDQYLEIVCCAQKRPRTKEAIRTGQRSNAECEKLRNKRHNVNFYILGGEAASPGEFPHMAALGYEQKGTQNLSWQCGGSLISERYVLTAAHCVESALRIGVPRIVRLGYTNLDTDDETGRDFLVEKFVVHPMFKNNANYYDIALLKLKDRVEFSNWIYPACLYSRQEDPYTNLTITGWGDTSGSGISPSPELMMGTVELVSLAACSKEYKADTRTPRGVDPAMLCATSPQRMDTCRGDSGGPLQLMELPRDSVYSVVGVTSFGPSPCGGKKPGVYTRVASYLPWIESVVWSSTKV